MSWNRANGVTLAVFMTMAGMLWLTAAGTWSGPGTAALGQQEEADRPMGRMQMRDGAPMRMMQRMHAGDDSAWEATEDAIYIIRGRQLTSHDPQTLELTAEAELPDDVSAVLGVEREEQAENGDRPRRMQRMERMQRMQQMMSEAQTSLSTELRVVGDAIYITRGDHLLRYTRDLELEESVQLPRLPETVDEPQPDQQQ